MERENLIIIGNGPAGGTAAVYAARAGLAPRLFAGDVPGGLLTQTGVVENFPGFPDGIDGFDLVMAIQKQAEKFGAKTDYDAIAALTLNNGGMHILRTADGREFETPALILATGATPRFSGVPGEERLRGHGVSACATCDGPFFKGVPVVVAGGGDSAMEEALFLTRFASVVHLVHRRAELRASAIMAQRARANEKIVFHLSSVIDEICGAKEVEAVKLKDTVSGTVSSLECKAVFFALGHTPATELFRAAGIECDDHGFIRLFGTSTETNVAGVFAAGDCADPRYRQAITAAGRGAAAAIDAERYLRSR